ncbi:MAG: glycosyltransferase [Gemmatimonadaceae bacterium]
MTVAHHPVAATAIEVLRFVDVASLLYFVVLNSFYALLLLLSLPEMWSHWHLAGDEHLARVLGADVLPPLTILVPAYNEEVTIGPSILSFLTLEYPRHEVVLVNDGSTDATLERLIAAYDLYQVPPAVPVTIPTAQVRAYYRSRRYSKLLVIDKANGGKGDSLNAAINAARYPYVLAVDADTLIEPDALFRLARPFLLGRSVAAVGGTIRVANDCTVAYGRVTAARVDRRMIPGIQVVEYLRAFLFGRLGWNRLGGNLIISGAFGLFRRDYLIAIGGYHSSTVGEDMDLVVRLRRYLRDNKLPDVIPFIPDPVAWTAVPTSWTVLGRQRGRWQRGLMQTLRSNGDMLFSPRYGSLGLFALPYFLFGEAMAPLVEVVGVVGTIVALALGVVNWPFAQLFLAVAFGYAFLISLWAIALDELSFNRYSSPRDLIRLVGFAALEQFGYRQIVAWYRIAAVWQYIRGERGWGVMLREGFVAREGARPVS